MEWKQRDIPQGSVELQEVVFIITQGYETPKPKEEENNGENEKQKVMDGDCERVTDRIKRGLGIKRR